MEQALERLQFTSLDEVTPDSLKRAFRVAVVNAHPDKGGKEEDFEAILEAYVCLSTTIKRMTGGRDGFQILNVFDVKQARDTQFTNELNNLVNDVFDHLDSSTNETFRKEFNELFEKNHVRESEQGYEEWLRNKDEEKQHENKADDPATWNHTFETVVKQGKPEPTSLILHPDEMAFVSGSTRGVALIPSIGHSFTSDPEERPEYTDLHAAYTLDNTVFDKIPSYQEKHRTFEDLLKERDMVYQTELDRDLEAISAYEKRKQEEETTYKKKIETYFASTSSSQWALRHSDSFVKEFK